MQILLWSRLHSCYVEVLRWCCFAALTATFYYYRLAIRIRLPRNKFFFNLTFKHDYQLFRGGVLLLTSLFQGTFCVLTPLFQGTFCVLTSLFQGTFVQIYTFFVKRTSFGGIPCTIIPSLFPDAQAVRFGQLPPP